MCTVNGNPVGSVLVLVLDLAPAHDFIFVAEPVFVVRLDLLFALHRIGRFLGTRLVLWLSSSTTWT